MSDQLVWLRGGLAVPLPAYLLVFEFEALGVVVRRDGTDLLVGPATLLTDAHLSALRTHKADILRLIDYCTRVDLDAHLYRDDSAAAPVARTA